MTPARAGRLILPAFLALLLGGGALLRAPAYGATPPPTPVPPKGSLSPFPTALQTRPPLPRKPPKIEAKSFLLADVESGQVLFARRPDAHRPIASLTKLMTALLIIEDSHPSERVTVSRDAAPPPKQIGISNLPLMAGESLSIRELLYALLLQSANDAAIALAEHDAGSVDSFVQKMNRRASQLGTRGTHFASPNGLDDSGYSTAADLSLIMSAALEHPAFRRISRTRFHTIPAAPGGEPRRIQNRDVLLWLYPGTIAGKTGFTSKAGYCLVAVAERDGRTLLVVVLGERSEPFSDAAELLDWGFGSFRAVTAASSGDPLGRRRVGNVQTEVAVGADLTGLVLRPEVGDIRLQVRIDAGAMAGSAPGTRVGTVTAVAPSGTVGEAPVVVARDGARLPWATTLQPVLEAYERTLEKVSG